MALAGPPKQFTVSDMSSAQFIKGMGGTTLINNLNAARADILTLVNLTQELHEETFNHLFCGGAIYGWAVGEPCNISHPGGLIVRVPLNSIWLIGNRMIIVAEQNCAVPAGAPGDTIRWLHIGQDGTCVVKTTLTKAAGMKWIIAARITASAVAVIDIDQDHDDVDKLCLPEGGWQSGNYGIRYIATETVIVGGSGADALYGDMYFYIDCTDDLHGINFEPDGGIAQLCLVTPPYLGSPPQEDLTWAYPVYPSDPTTHCYENYLTVWYDGFVTDGGLIRAVVQARNVYQCVGFTLMCYSYS